MGTYGFARASVVGGSDTASIWFFSKDFDISDGFSVAINDGRRTFEVIKEEIATRGYKPLLVDFERDLNGNESYKIELEIDLSV